MKFPLPSPSKLSRTLPTLIGIPINPSGLHSTIRSSSHSPLLLTRWSGPFHTRRSLQWNRPARFSSSGGNEAPTKEQQVSDHGHCVDLVRTRDMEGYLCGLLMPTSSKQAYFALRAFNAEIAGIKDASRRSRDAIEGSSAPRMRIQWWRDGIADIYDGDSDSDGIVRSIALSRHRNPVLRSLSDSVREHGLTRGFLRRMIDAREEDLDVPQHESCRDVAQYGEDTVSNLLYLTLECVGVRDDASDKVASDVGVGLGLITAIRSTAFRAMQGEYSIPLELTSKYSITMDTIRDAANAHNGESPSPTTPESQESLRNAAREIAHMASFHLHRAREKQSVLPSEARVCLLPAVCGLHYLTSLEACDYDVFHPSLVGGTVGGGEVGLERRRRLGLMFVLGRAWLTGTF